jgi:undecaprenyl-diphosphatase
MLGLLQGLTGFLPLSASGHLALAQHFIEGFEQPGALFGAMLHGGTLLAVIMYFWSDIRALAISPFRRSGDSGVHRKILLLILAGSLPTAVLGLTFRGFAQGLFGNLLVVSSLLLVSGTVLFVAERFRRGTRKQSQLTLGDALLVGTAQGLAVFPGISRTGATIALLMLRGVEGETAVRFSFLLALPAIFGVSLLSLVQIRAVSVGEVPLYLAGMAIAFVSGYLAIRFLLAVIRRRRLFLFALYCWGVGSLFLTLSF